MEIQSGKVGTGGIAIAPPKPIPQQPQPTTGSATSATTAQNDPALQIPELIVDVNSKKSYIRGRFLGKGGFARCYEVTESKTKEVLACKVVSKTLLVKVHQREKMAQEISIHRELEHQYIVKFFSYFEDELNVYVLLELCNKKSLMEMQKRRRVLTEPEARYLFRQILYALNYLHDRKVIHRDLKLGNIFISDSMELKIGDFGLATTVERHTTKRFTLCGTPNYIAPEVLAKKGHSFEVDIWSSGCILYTLLIGRPPFETTTLKETYGKIRRGDYCVPPGKISTGARHLISKMLQVDPALRPTAKQLLNSEYIAKSWIPKTLPTTVLTMPPRFDRTQMREDPKTPTQRNPLFEQNHKSSPATALVPNVASVPFNMPKPGSGDENGSMKKVTMTHMKHLIGQIADVLSSKPTLQRVDNDLCEDPNAAPIVWISKWVDYSDKYGFGYQLSDDSIGVSYNDTTKMILLPDRSSLQYVDKSGQEFFYDWAKTPEELQKKLKLLNYFKLYMTENLIKAGGNTNKMDYSMARLPTLWTWFRTSRAVVMVLTNGTLQINNFRDHTKTIFCPCLEAVTTLEPNKPMKTYRFEYIKSFGCTLDLAEKLQYAQEKLDVLLGTKPDGTPASAGNSKTGPTPTATVKPTTGTGPTPIATVKPITKP